jgi:hypothetical protein
MKAFIHFCTKYVFRTLHLASFAFLVGNIVVDYLFGKRTASMELTAKQAYTKLHIAASIVVIVSGLINMALLLVESKFKKDSHYKVWKLILWIKFFATLTLTPVLERVLPSTTDKELYCQQIRLVLITGTFLVSPFLRYYREKFLTKTLDNTNYKME